MAHGSKKFIVDHTGKIKRSRHRTKEDYYGELYWWRPMVSRWNKKGNFCPQCKARIKVLQKFHDEYEELMRPIKEEWEKKYGNTYMVKVDEKYLYYYDFVRRHPKYPGSKWQFNDENFMCPKHQRWYELQDEMYRSHLPGDKKHYRWSIREDRRNYRNTIKHMMRNEQFDDLPDRKKDWLD